MIKHLIKRPISVIMAFTALFIIGIITYLNVPVSLLPDINIPEITVQVTGKNTSARELENTVVTPLRQQLLQINKLRDARTETRDGNAIIRMNFEYGTNTDLAFIETNEKIDAAMNYLPKETDRPRVIKASATDIPVFNLYLTLKSDRPYEPTQKNAFLDLSEFAENVIRRRIEQLPEIAMVDMSGIIRKEVLIVPDNNLLESCGITYSDLEGVLKDNNIEPGSMIIRDGHYEYNIKFSAILRTVEDIQNIYIRKNGKIFQFKDLAQIALATEKEEGMVLYNGKRAVCLGVIKQSEEKMSTMQQSLTRQIEGFQHIYPDIDFSVSQNQTELLDYTISNLQQNLLLAFIFICLVSVFFMKDIRSPIIIGINVFVSLVICILFFYLFHISMNVVSLTGLILALGMMIDNSIIVTDNIEQYRKQKFSIEESCVKGTNEVIAPILSSTLTTISVFVPLIFLSGIAGAIFFDQAFSVTIGQLVSYFTGIILLPVSYLLIHKIKRKNTTNTIPVTETGKISTEKEYRDNLAERIYHRGVDWVFEHKVLTTIIILAILPVGYWLFLTIPKEKMPDISQSELMARVEWNENIHIEENTYRINQFLQVLDGKIIENAAQIGQQQFLLNREREQTASESEIYFRINSKKEIPALKKIITHYFSANYPQAIISFSPVETIFEKIFQTGAPELTVEYYTKNKSIKPEISSLTSLEKKLIKQTGETPSGISFQKQLNVTINQEKLLLYRVPYNTVYQALKTGFKGNEISVMRSYQQYLPIVLGGEEKTVQELLDNTLIQTSPDNENKQYSLPLSYFVTVTPAEDLKTIVAGKNGEYIPLDFQELKNPEKIIELVKKDVSQRDVWDIDFSGNFFTNKKMIGELMIILFISVLLMYFILTAQFESFKQPLIVLAEIPIDLAASLGLLLLLGHSLNLMSAIGLVVSCGIIINDSILKVDMINQLRKEGMPLMDAIHISGKRRLKAILMTSLTSISCMLPLLFSSDMGSELEKPLAIATIGGMVIGTPVSLFVVPLIYWWFYRDKS